MLNHPYCFSLLRPLLASEKLTSIEVSKQLLHHIEEQKDLNAFINVYDQEIIENASIVNHKIKKGKAGPLAGMVILIRLLKRLPIKVNMELMAL